nr:TNT domain-containing protein [Evansella caseinilytica]
MDDLGNLFHVPAENKHTLEKLTTNKFKPDGVGVGGGLVNDVGEAKKLISQADRNKLNGWKYAPNDELYLKYKDVYDNPKYFNQETGDITWPGTKGDPNIDGFVNGEYKIETLKPGTEIDRYGSNPSGQYFSPAGSSYESRALPPHMSEQPYTKYRVVKDFDVKSGKIAPWFDEVGGGIQFNSQIKILDKYGDAYDATVENLVKLGYIKKID